MLPLEKTLGVLGYPLEHLLSPLMINTAIEELRLPYRLFPFEVPTDDLEDAVRGIRALGIHGFALTIPHKEAVIEIADLITDRATLIGAANTLIFRADGKIHADNTDGYGFIENLKAGAPDWDP